MHVRSRVSYTTQRYTSWSEWLSEAPRRRETITVLLTSCYHLRTTLSISTAGMSKYVPSGAPSRDGSVPPCNNASFRPPQVYCTPNDISIGSSVSAGLADTHNIHSIFCNRVITTWNSLPASVNFANLTSFKRSLKCVDLSSYLIEQ